MADYIEGKRPIIEALRSGVPLRSILMADNLKRDPLVNDIQRKAKRLGIKIDLVSRKTLDNISDHGSHQGIIAKASPFAYQGIHELIALANISAEQHEGRALVLLLDHLTDAGNLGAIVRSAEAVGAAGIVIPNKRSARVEASTYKSSAGAIAHMPIAQVANLAQAISLLQKAGFWVAGASEHATDLIWETNLKGKLVLVLGNEHEGISRVVAQSCDFLCKLPLEGQVSSLHVAQAARACLYEWLRPAQGSHV